MFEYNVIIQLYWRYKRLRSRFTIHISHTHTILLISKGKYIMSKIILKVGPSTARVEQDQIKSLSFGESPRTTIKYALNGSVVFFDRNPYYATITVPHETQCIIELLKQYDDTEDKKYLSMAMMNIESTLCAYVSRNFLGEYAEANINALKNAKAIGRRQAGNRINNAS